MIALVASFALAGAWVPVSQTAVHGALRVSVSYEQQAVDPAGDVKIYRDLRVRVANGHAVVFDRSVCAQVCGPAQGGAISFRNIWSTPRPEVVVSLYTGGAHCCFESELVLLRSPTRAIGIFHDWGDLGYRGQWSKGRFWFVTGDDRFAYAFTSFAASEFPTRVWSIDSAGRLVDVTRRRLDLVAANARRLWKDYLGYRGHEDVRGVLGPWCADEYLLGKAAACDAALGDALSRGYLKTDVVGVGGEAYVRLLHRDLAAWGYTRA